MDLDGFSLISAFHIHVHRARSSLKSTTQQSESQASLASVGIDEILRNERNALGTVIIVLCVHQVCVVGVKDDVLWRREVIRRPMYVGGYSNKKVSTDGSPNTLPLPKNNTPDNVVCGRVQKNQGEKKDKDIPLFMLGSRSVMKLDHIRVIMLANRSYDCGLLAKGSTATELL